MSKDYCTEPECPNCTRNDAHILTDERVDIVTYVGQYVVQTVMAPETANPLIALAIAMAGPDDKLYDYPIFITTVGFLGDEHASISDSKFLVADDDFMRFYERHNNTEMLSETHRLVAEMVKEDYLDLSSPISHQQFNEESRELAREFGLLRS